MKKFMCCVTLFISTIFNGFSQEKIIEVKDFKIPDPTFRWISDSCVVFLGKNGLVTKIKQNNESNISYFNHDGELVWKTTAPKEYSKRNDFEDHPCYDMRRNFIVASNSGSWVYNVEMKPSEIYIDEQYITQIDKDGNVKKFTIEPREELGKSLQTVFCDDRYFYYLMTDNGYERNSKKMSEEKLILNRFDAKNFSYKRIVLELPSITSGLYWNFIGQTDSEKFLVTSEVSIEDKLEDEKSIITIVAFNDEGQITRTFKLEPKPKEKFLRRSCPIKSPVMNFHQQSEFSYGSHIYGSIIRVDGGWFGHITLDQATGSFFVYGLSGPETIHISGNIYDSFYIFKYDINGVNEWKIEQPVSQQMLSDKYFRVRALPGYRNLFLRVLPDNRIYFSIQSKKSLYAYEISPDGKPGNPSMKESRNMSDPLEFKVNWYE